MSFCNIINTVHILIHNNIIIFGEKINVNWEKIKYFINRDHIIV